jgi:hypothetical protein
MVKYIIFTSPLFVMQNYLISLLVLVNMISYDIEMFFNIAVNSLIKFSNDDGQLKINKKYVEISYGLL